MTHGDCRSGAAGRGCYALCRCAQSTSAREWLKTMAEPAKNLVVGGRFSFFRSTIPKQDSSFADAWL